VGPYRAVHPVPGTGGNRRGTELQSLLALGLEFRNGRRPLGLVARFRMASLGRMCTYSTLLSKTVS
jgi:hypothetical protein